MGHDHAWPHALFCYEYGHGELGIECANAAYDALFGLPGNADCDALVSSANAAFQSILDECHANDAAYDVATNRCATQGVRFPP